MGRYTLLAEAARGGMGVVFRAQGPEGEPVALKLLLAGRSASEVQRRRFQQEVRALLRLRHPGVVRILDAGEADGAPWMALEWIEGESLEQRLARGGALDIEDAIELTRRLAEALEHCHAQGVLHRDLKPDNVLLRARDGQPLLTDFGLTRELDGASTAFQLTVAGRLLGTPGYWAPEQARGELERIGPATDVFGLGAVLFAALTGRPPLRAGSLVEALEDTGRRAPPPSALRPEVPSALDAVCGRCLALDPAERYPTARALLLDLARLQGAGPASRRPRARAAVLLVCGLGVTGGVAALLLAPDRPAAPLSPERPAGPAEAAPAAPLAEARRAWLRLDLERARDLASQAIASAPAGERAEPALLLAQAHLFRLLSGPATGSSSPEAELAGARAALPLALEARDPARLALARGLAATAARDSQAAGAEFRAALELREDADAVFWRGLWLESAGDHAAAADLCTRALRLEPGFVAALVQRGAAREALGELDGAIADYDHAIELAPPVPLLYYSRGVARRARRDPRGALADHGRAIELEPLYRHPYRGRALARLDLGDHAGAIADYGRLLALDPTGAGAWWDRGRVHALAGDPGAALADFDRALELDPRSAVAWNSRGLALVARGGPGDLEAARAAYDRAIELDPREAGPWSNRAHLRQRAGDLSGAEQDLSRALELAPESGAVRANRGILRHKLGDWRGAIADYERALTLLPPLSPEAERLGPALREARARLEAR